MRRRRAAGAARGSRAGSPRGSPRGAPGRARRAPAWRAPPGDGRSKAAAPRRPEGVVLGVLQLGHQRLPLGQQPGREVAGGGGGPTATEPAPRPPPAPPGAAGGQAPDRPRGRGPPGPPRPPRPPPEPSSQRPKNGGGPEGGGG